MRQRPRLPFVRLLALMALAAAALPARADAACTLSACDAAALIGNAQCCTASACTIDGTLTVSAATCTFDFGTRNLTVSGQIAAQGKAVTLRAKSMKVTGSGLIDVRGPGGAAAGSVTIVTTGMTAVAYSQEGGISSGIDASSSGGAGGDVVIQADGAVMLSKGSVKADGGPLSVGGFVDLTTTSGDVSVQIPVTATGGIPPVGPTAGAVSVTTPGTLAIGGSGRLVADLGTIGAVIGDTLSIAAGGYLEANGGGDITVVAGSISSLGEFRANGDFGSVDLTAATGPLFLSLPTNGITVGPGGGVTLTTDSAGVDGTLTVDMPIVASGGAVEISSAGSIVVSRKIETTGILDSGAGEVTLEAVGDVHVTKAIVTSDFYSVEDVGIEAGGDVVIEGTIEQKGTGDTDGGVLTIVAAGDLTVQGDVSFNVSALDLENSGGSIELQAGGDLTIGNSVELIADGGPSATAGSIDLLAGVDEVGAPRLPGNLTLQGDIKANGHSIGANHVTINGCAVQIATGSIIDITGDAGSTNTVIARTSLTIAGQLKATGANVLEFGQGATLSLTGSFTPARSAGTCTNGTVTADGCQRPLCTADNVPNQCLYACPTCGDSVTTFPETCENGAGGPSCNALLFCDARCRQRNCADQNPCTIDSCDEPQGCQTALQPNGTSCTDGNVCDGVEACQGGNCVVTPGTVPSCGSDGNPCTADGCDPLDGCFHDPLDGTIAGCDDQNPCTGTETCDAGTCETGTLVTCPQGQVCNPANGQCEGAASCQNAGQCDDANPCTDDVCAGTCSNPPKANGASCDDGDMCNGLRTCSSGICQPPTSPVVCDDSNVCTTDACNPLTGTCTNAPITSCCNTAGDCNDTNACTTDSCDDHACTHGTVTCDDANACTTDSCNVADGCHNDAIVPCEACASPATCSDDADACTDKACLDGRCQQVPNPNCCASNADCVDIDSNPCTNNGPCTANRCEGPFPLDGTACGTPCNPATCDTGTCVLDAPMDCNDSNLCTNDVCTDDQGCTHPAIAECCTAPGQCEDQNVCTADSCDLDANQCSNVVTDETCSPCAGGDPFECGPRCANACVAGRCQAVVPDCDDDNPCTADACDPDTGCGNTPVDGTGIDGCDDGQACNGTETCTAGTCNQQPSPECDDDDACTDDSCNDTSGCSNVQKTGYPSILCRLGAMTDAVNGAAADAIKAKLKKSTLKKIAKLRTKVEAASAPSAQCKKAKKTLTGAAKTLRAMQRAFAKGSGRKLDAALATTLGDLAADGAAGADTVRAGLGC